MASEAGVSSVAVTPLEEATAEAIVVAGAGAMHLTKNACNVCRHAEGAYFADKSKRARTSRVKEEYGRTRPH